MITDTLITQVLCYIFEKHSRFSEYFTRTDGGTFSVLECGQQHEADHNIFSNTFLEVDGIQYKTNAIIFNSSTDWLAWQKKNKKEAENIGLVIVANNNEDVEKYASEPILNLCIEIPSMLMERIYNLTSSNGVQCIQYFSQLDGVVKQSIFDRYAIERLETKRNKILSADKQLGGDWSKTFIYMLFDSIMISNKRNRKNFNVLARLIGYDTIIQHLDDSVSFEALLFGTAGLLHVGRRHDEYTIMLERRFMELKRSYNIEVMDSSVWNFQNRNQGNTLWIVVAQLSMLLLWHKNSFLSIANNLNLKEIFGIFTCGASSYWSNHSVLSGEQTRDLGERIMSKSRQERMIINGIVPFLFAYYRSQDIYDNNEKLLDIMEQLDDEVNGITSKWALHGVKSANAIISQAIIEIDKVYCTHQRCTQCMIGRIMIG